MVLLKTTSDQISRRSDRKMQTKLLLLIFLGYSGWANGLCSLENGTIAYCHELEDVKYIETYNLESLKASASEPVLHPGFFANLTSLRHLDLSRAGIERIEPETFHKLSNLRSLDLSENRLEYLELGSIDGLHHLHKLNLRKNKFKQLPPVLARLKVLKYLDVQGNPLECNCATLRVRDLIVKRGVKIIKKVFCAGPNNVKGALLLKADTTTICNFEEQDREMQNDQPNNDLEEENGSGDIFDKEDDNEEYVEIPISSSESSKEVEIETPFPRVLETTTSLPSTSSLLNANTVESSETSINLSEEISAQLQITHPTEKTTSEDKIYVDYGDTSEPVSTAATVPERKKLYKDDLFYPVEGSGDENEGSGEGSGALFGDWMKVGKVEKTDEDEEDSSAGGGLLDLFFSVFLTTEAPKGKDPDLEEEQFIDVSSTKEVEKEIVTEKVSLNEKVASSTEAVTVELVNDQLHDTSRLGKVQTDDVDGEVEDEVDSESAEVSPKKQSKKGMGSYVVLAAVLAILASLIGFAAYKGDFCRKKRKRNDVERGTELKDMQKALLETGNSAQPKIAASTNGNVENVPLVVDATDHDETKVPNDRRSSMDASKLTDTAFDHMESVMSSRGSSPQNDQRAKDMIGQDSNSLNDDSVSARISSADPVMSSNTASRLPGVNGPPLSPGAQRVKIVLQENLDSVPRTPILITRTMAGENLVKAP